MCSKCAKCSVHCAESSLKSDSGSIQCVLCNVQHFTFGSGNTLRICREYKYTSTSWATGLYLKKNLFH